MRAAELGIPCVERSIFLGAINRLFDRVINISGTNEVDMYGDVRPDHD